MKKKLIAAMLTLALLLSLALTACRGNKGGGGNKTEDPPKPWPATTALIKGDEINNVFPVSLQNGQSLGGIGGEYYAFSGWYTEELELYEGEIPEFPQISPSATIYRALSRLTRAIGPSPPLKSSVRFISMEPAA